MLKYFIFCVDIAVPFPSHAELLQGRVVGVTDGDTITLLDNTSTQYKVILSGIDAPEKKQPVGQKSKQSLSQLTFDEPVLVEWSKLDRYGRIVGKVTKDEIDINLEQGKRGLRGITVSTRKNSLSMTESLIFTHKKLP